MVERVSLAYVYLWGELIGVTTWDAERDLATFEYDRAFLDKGWDIAPLLMPLEDARRGDGIYAFPGPSRETYLGLPGLLADSLPDKFGNRVIDAWMNRQGITAADFNPIERLCYTGRRGTGALEFAPLINKAIDQPIPVEIAELVALAQTITSDRKGLQVDINADERMSQEALTDILRVSTSAGGNRPKAVIGLNDEGHVLSGQLDLPPGYCHWLLKFDGVDDLELGKPQNYGRREYAYHLMASAAGIDMNECRLLEENGRAHFMTLRFDRQPDNGKIGKVHMQTLCGIAHYDFNMAGAYSYEQAFTIMRQLRLPKSDAIQQYRRMLFNVLARNQDDHTKNVAFLMNRHGDWSLSPAYDVTYAADPANHWLSRHQMTINGKRDGFRVRDLVTVGESIGVKKPGELIDEIREVVSRWPDYAAEARLPADDTRKIAKAHRLSIA